MRCLIILKLQTKYTNKPKPMSFPLYCVTSLKSFKRTKEENKKYRWNSSCVFILFWNQSDGL